jgi:hypothetical protein
MQLADDHRHGRGDDGLVQRGQQKDDHHPDNRYPSLGVGEMGCRQDPGSVIDALSQRAFRVTRISEFSRLRFWAIR